MLGLLVPGVHMGAGDSGAPSVTYVEPIGRKHGVVRPDGPDINMPTGVTGVS